MGIILFLREVYWLVQVGELTGGRPEINRMDSRSGAQRGLVTDQHLVRGSNWAKMRRQEIPGPLENQQMVLFAEEWLGWRQIKLDRQRRPWRTDISFREALAVFDKNGQWCASGTLMWQCEEDSERGGRVGAQLCGWYHTVKPWSNGGWNAHKSQNSRSNVWYQASLQSWINPNPQETFEVPSKSKILAI